MIKKYKIKNKFMLGDSDIAPFRKKDPGEKFHLNKLNINRFGYPNNKRNYSIIKLLCIYGFNKNYIKRFKKQCILSVKRTLNYKRINPHISKKFYFDFYNLLFK